MSDPTTFESRLAAALQRRADQAPTTVDAHAVAHSASTTAARPSALARAFGTPRWGTARLLVVVGLLVLLSVAGVVLASQLLAPKPSLGRLVPAGTMTAARGGQTATLLPDGRVLLAGGTVNTSADPGSAEVYDPVTATFTRTAGSMTTGIRIGEAAAALPDGRVLIVGGIGTLTEDAGPVPLPFAELYDPTTGTFRRTGRMIRPRQSVSSVVALPDGRVLVAGGDGEAGIVAAVELFDPITNTFVRGGPLTAPRSGHTMTLLPDGRVLLAGGYGADDEFIATAEIYDPMTGTSVPTGDLGSARSDATAVALADGRVLIVGGNGPGPYAAHGSEALGSAELYDPTTMKFQPTGGMITERSGATAVRLSDGRVLVAGGFNVDGDPRTIEVYDPASGRFEVAGKLAAARTSGNSNWLSTTLLNDGSVLLAGDESAVAERYDPSLPAEPSEPATSPVVAIGFQAVAGPGALRTGHTATRLADGKILIAGGNDTGSGPAMASAEIFDPATERSTPTGSMAVARSGHVATLLTNGRVLIAGGLGYADVTAPWPSAEIYDPDAGTFSPAGVMTVAHPNTHISSIGGTPSAITLPDGRVFIGGWDPSRTDGGSSSMEMYDPVAGDFRAIVAPSGRRLGQIHGASLLKDGRVLILDGPDPDSDNAALQADVYDPVTDTWTNAGTTGMREQFTATGLLDGRVLITGGMADRHADTPLATAQIWDPVSGMFSGTGGMASARTGHAATLLPEGRLLITGGNNFDWSGVATIQDFPAPEVWDPASGAFSPVGTMAAQRSGHTATALDDGRVLLVGGVTRSSDRTDPVPPFAELYRGR